MQETFERVSKQITERWNVMDKSDKFKISLAVIFALIALGIGVFVFTKSTYVPLTHGDANYKQISEIQKVLDSNNISYRLGNDGSEIMVDQKNLGKAKIAISTEDILGSEYSWGDYVSENMMGLTESQKQQRYIEVKKFQIADAIKNIEGVKSAIVELTVPKDSPFVGDDKGESKAGIILTLTKQLSQKQVQGIAKFVAHSVEGLRIANITIQDTSGNLLFSGDEESDDSIVGSASRYDEIKSSREKEVEKKVKELLAPMYGDVKVKANLVINRDKYRETSEKYSSPFEDGKKGIPTAEQTENTSSENGTTAAEPGYESNSGNTDYYTGNGSSSKAGTEKNSTTYAVNKTVSELEKSTGEVLLNDSSISVLVYKNKTYDQDSIKKQGLLADTTWDDYVSNIESEAQAKKMTIEPEVLDLVKKATGITDIVVSGIEKPIFIESKPFNFPVQDYIPIVMMLVFVGFIAWILTRKPKTTDMPHLEAELSVEQMLSSTGGGRARSRDDLPEIQEHDSETKRRIEDFIEQKPQLVAQLLKNWIAEDWE